MKANSLQKVENTNWEWMTHTMLEVCTPSTLCQASTLLFYCIALLRLCQREVSAFIVLSWSLWPTSKNKTKLLNYYTTIYFPGWCSVERRLPVMFLWSKHLSFCLLDVFSIKNILIDTILSCTHLHKMSAKWYRASCAILFWTDIKCLESTVMIWLFPIQQWMHSDANHFQYIAACSCFS